MMIWMEPQCGSHSNNYYDDHDEKGGKLRRARRDRRDRVVRNALAAVTVVFFIAFLQLHHSQQRTLPGNNQRVKFKQEGHEQHSHRRGVQEPQLPALSIYRLDVENQLGNMTSLGKYAGMVTLVVNTACK